MAAILGVKSEFPTFFSKMSEFLIDGVRISDFHCAMNATSDTETTHLPVDLRDIPDATKTYLIGLHAATGRPIADLVAEILDNAATQEEGRP
jgi:hypothetical protein